MSNTKTTLLTTLIRWDGQAALIVAADAQLWRHYSGTTSDLEGAHSLFQQGRLALLSAGARLVGAPHHAIPWGVNERPFVCPQLARYAPALRHDSSRNTSTTQCARNLLQARLPAFVCPQAFEALDAHEGYSMEHLSQPVEWTRTLSEIFSEHFFLTALSGSHSDLSRSPARL